MLDVNDLQQAGQSTTRRAWFTNPARRAMLAIVRPYLAFLIQAINALDQRLNTGRADQHPLAKGDRIHMLLDGLSKDLLASSHRLGSIEDDARESEQKIEDLKKRFLQVEEAVELHNEASRQLASPVGMPILMPNRPIAVFGTSLIIHSGPYGRFLLRQPDLISDHILAGSFWDSHLKPVIERTGRSDASAVDAGAYLGFHSVYMSLLKMTGHAFTHAGNFPRTPGRETHDQVLEGRRAVVYRRTLTLIANINVSVNDKMESRSLVSRRARPRSCAQFPRLNLERERFMLTVQMSSLSSVGWSIYDLLRRATGRVAAGTVFVLAGVIGLSIAARAAPTATAGVMGSDQASRVQVSVPLVPAGVTNYKCHLTIPSGAALPPNPPPCDITRAVLRPGFETPG
jgi:hypothetical protein